MPYKELLKGRISLKNQIYHVTWATYNRKPVFNEFRNARLIIHCLKFAHDNDWCESLCFCVMPDHIHWLIQIKSRGLADIMSAVKGYSDKQFKKQTLWQRGYYDHAIRKEEDLVSIARYIVANPLRAKIASSVKEYPHWDAIWIEKYTCRDALRTSCQAGGLTYSDTATMQNNYSQLLKQTFGFDQFRPGQDQVVSQLLSSQSSLAIFPTGSGKSLCYQFTATQLPNLTLVVSPLLALMKDQLDFLQAKGIPAASLDSTLSPDEYQQVMRDVRANKTKILMVSVERFKNERFREFIQGVPISMLVVDEAHCISEWGHNFRPDYLKLPLYCQQLNIPLVLLLTATATKKVKLDMAAKFNIQPQHIIQTGFYRPNLDLTVLPVKESDKKQQLAQLIQQQAQANGGSGIVYVTLQNTAEEVAQYLNNQLQQSGIKAAAYHAGFDSDTRETIQQDFMADKTQVIVATIAFGMGIDKSNIRFVMHYDLPKSIENYSQEIGRAGRDGQPSNCITLANLDGLHTVENFVYGDTPELSAIDTCIDRITQQSEVTRNGSQWEVQIIGFANEYNIRQLPMKTLLVQLELLDVLTPKYSYYAEFKYKFLLPQEEILEKFQGERKDFLKAIFDTSQHKKVWSNINFDTLFTQYQSERSRVVAALDYLEEKQMIELSAGRMTEVYEVNQTNLSNPNLAQELFDYFKDKEEKEIKRIAALVRFFELDRCLSHNLSRYFDDQNSPEQCGHCSVCRGHVAKLEYSESQEWPEDSVLIGYLKGLKQHIVQKAKEETTISIDSYSRFLTGMSVPMFSRLKVRSLQGFASCETLRYELVKEKVMALITHI